MTQGVYCIAGHVFRICSLYPDVQQMCADYQSSEEPEFTISTTRHDIESEARQSEITRQKEGLSPYTYSEGYLETLAVYRKLVVRLADDDIILFHGSAVAVDGYCYLFTARSGTGKSTHVRLWRKLLGARATMVNDDKPLIRIRDGVATVFGTPWDGKHHLSNNISMPLRAIALLERGLENSIVPVSIPEALPMLLQQTYRPDDGDKLMKVMQLIGGLAQSVALYRLKCNMQDEAAKVAFEGMSHEQI